MNQNDFLVIVPPCNIQHALFVSKFNLPLRPILATGMCVILPTIDPKRCFILSYDLRAKKIDGLIEQFGTHGKKRKRVAVLDVLLAEVNPAA